MNASEEMGAIMGQLHYGIHQQLEDAATALIKESLEGVTSMAAKSDILTPWKEQDRKSREVYNKEGAPDGALRRGMFHRVYNPQYRHLNSMNGKVPVSLDLLSSAPPQLRDYDDTIVHVGMTYDLTIQWGNNTRIKCVGCSRFIKNAPETNCSGCGATYAGQSRPGHFKVLSLPS